MKKVKDRMIDNILTHRIWGFPVFLLFLYLTFQATFTFGAYPMDWIDALVGGASDFLQANMADSVLKDLLVDGVLGGVGAVIIFLPNILILFFCISLMEDTGYMARASFIMDKLMHKIGLHGQSFIPLIMGFGCNVPAIMATRRLENRNDRILTMLIIPFMSCSARLPVYVLLIGAFFSSYAALVLFSVYMLGILLAIVSSMIFKKVFFKHEEVPFVMELPPYRVPTMRNIASHTWGKAVEYLKKMGGTILVASLIIWLLGYLPRNPELSKDYQAEITKIEQSSISGEEKASKIASIELERDSERRQKSIIGRLGNAMQPIFAPMRFDDKISVSLLTGLPAKEIIVSTMGVLYSSDTHDGEDTEGLQGALRSHNMSVPTTLALLAFILIYFPCIAVIAAIKREGSTGWAIFTMFYTTGLAWVVSFLVYNIADKIILLLA
jgi:ferrous iron transport protein B